VEVISSVERDGRPVFRDLRWGVYVTFSAESEYVRRCFKEYGLVTDDSGNYSAMYRPYHLIGLELGTSVASVALRREPTGSPTGFRGDVVAIAKRDLKPGETLDGEGGCTVYGRLMPASDSLVLGDLPIGLTCGAKLVRARAKGEPLKWGDVETIESDAACFRQQMEALFTQEQGLAGLDRPKGR
jgi:predicted homoserine dehydrogenase-like protein